MQTTALRADEFAASRMVEAVVRGIDLDDLLARRTTGRRPAALSDDLDWILAASGRVSGDDNRLPLIG